MVLEILNKSNKFIGGSVTIPYKSDVANILGENLTEEAKNIRQLIVYLKMKKM